MRVSKPGRLLLVVTFFISLNKLRAGAANHTKAVVLSNGFHSELTKIKLADMRELQRALKWQKMLEKVDVFF